MRKMILVLVAALLLIPSLSALAHCEVPCGIYGDQNRLMTMMEHLDTIEKAMKKIEALGAEEKVNHNQLVRWVNTKEEHATALQHIISQYWMTQRIKPTSADDKEAFAKYQKMLTQLHLMLRFSMKCKQGTDVKNVAKVRSLMKDFHMIYFEGKEDHMNMHHKHHHKGQTQKKK